MVACRHNKELKASSIYGVFCDINYLKVAH